MRMRVGAAVLEAPGTEAAEALIACHSEAADEIRDPASKRRSPAGTPSASSVRACVCKRTLGCSEDSAL